jgi:hypothetical protein
MAREETKGPTLSESKFGNQKFLMYLAQTARNSFFNLLFDDESLEPVKSYNDVHLLDELLEEGNDMR